MIKKQSDTDYDDLPEFAEVVNRVFGTTVERPCNDPNVIECRMWACQSADRCQQPKPTVQ